MLLEFLRHVVSVVRRLSLHIVMTAILTLQLFFLTEIEFNHSEAIRMSDTDEKQVDSQPSDSDSAMGASLEWVSPFSRLWATLTA